MTPSNSGLERLTRGTRTASLKKTAPSTTEKQKKQSTRKLAFSAASEICGVTPIPETPEKKVTKTPAKTPSKTPTKSAITKTPRKEVKPTQKAAKTPAKTAKTPTKLAPKTPTKSEATKTPRKEAKPTQKSTKTPAKTPAKTPKLVKKNETVQKSKTPQKSIENKENVFKPRLSRSGPKFNFIEKTDIKPFDEKIELKQNYSSARERRLAYSKQLQQKNRRLGVKGLTKKPKTGMERKTNTLLQSKRNLN